MRGCNAQGVMNSGVTKVIRDRYPGAFDVYRGVISEIINRNLKGVSHTLWTLPGAAPTRQNAPRA